jgi:hypothetical protein
MVLRKPRPTSRQLANKDDLQKVKAVGFDLDTDICNSARVSNHFLDFFIGMDLRPRISG